MADFVGGQKIDGIPYLFKDYLELADWTGRIYKSNVECLILNGELKDKNTNRKEQTLFRAKGYISDKEPEIISKLGIDAEKWLDTVKEYSKNYHAFVGSEKQLKVVCENTGKKWLSGIKSSRLLYC